MKLRLEFDLPEERDEADNAFNGTSWKCVVAALDSNLRNTTKYGELDPDVHVALENVRKVLLELLEDYNLTLD